MKYPKLLVNLLFIVLFNSLLLNIFTQHSKASKIVACNKKKYINGTTGVVTNPQIRGLRVGKFVSGGVVLNSCLIPKSVGKFIGFYSDGNFVYYNPDDFFVKVPEDVYIQELAYGVVKVVNDRSTGQRYYSVVVGNKFVLD